MLNVADDTVNPVEPFLRSDRMPHIWCPGCGIGTTVNSFARALIESKIDLQSLALVAEVVHGAPSRFADPARFSFAHGGKDGHPFPVPLKTYDESLCILRRALDAAKLGAAEKLEGFRRLDRLTRNVEANLEPLADFTAAVDHERRISPAIGGRTVFDDRSAKGHKNGKRELSLFPE